MINAALKIEDLRIPPGNRLESLKGISPVTSASELTINTE